MRSSTLSSSKSYISKFKFKQSVVCPIKQKTNKIVALPIGNKKKKNANHAFLQVINLCDTQQIKMLPFVTYANKQLLTHQQALSFLSSSSKDLQIQFSGCVGNTNLASDFFQGISQLSQVKFTNLDCKQHQNGLFLYNFSIKKKNKIHYFIHLRVENSQNNEDMLYILSLLSSQLIIFIGQDQRKGYLERILKTFMKIGKDLKNEPFSLSLSKTSHIIFKDKIIMNQKTLSEYELVFQSVSLNWIKSSSINLTGSKVLEQHNLQKINKIVQYFIQQQSTQISKNLLFKAKYIPNILQYANQKIAKTQLKTDSLIHAENDLSIPSLIKNIYEKKMVQIKFEYQQFVNKLDFDALDSQDKLFDLLNEKEQKTLNKFNEQNFSSLYHQAYQDQLLNDIYEFQAKVISNYELYILQRQQGKNSDYFEQGQKEVDSKESLLQAIQQAKDRYKMSENPRNEQTVQKILILARNAARLNILGYDQKMKIAELRYSIDQKWREYQIVIEQKQKKYQQPTQVNLCREKYKMMQQKICSLQDKASFLNKEILLTQNILQFQGRELELRSKEYQQLAKVMEKQQTLIQFIANSSVEDPQTHNLKREIQIVNGKNKEICLKKELIFQSLHQTAKLEH